MERSFQFVTSRQFLAGIAVATLAAAVVVGGIPNLLRTATLPAGFNQTFDTVESPVRGAARSEIKVVTALTPDASEQAIRRTVRTGSMQILANSSRETSEKIQQLAERFGGFVESSESDGPDDASSASLTIHVPAATFEQVRAEIRHMGSRIENEKFNAQDVTKQYVDQAARLHNLRAQEAQYLGILKQAKTVHDTMAVSEQLNDVRGEVEQQQAEFDTLSKQVEMVALTVTLRAEEEAQVFGLQWRPLYELKLAAREGLNGIADYAASMTSVVFYLPTILLWLSTVLMGAALGWRILGWAGRTFFARKPA